MARTLEDSRLRTLSSVDSSGGLGASAIDVESVMSRPRFSCYSPARAGSAVQSWLRVQLGRLKVVRWQGGREARKAERTYIDVLFSSGK